MVEGRAYAAGARHPTAISSAKYANAWSMASRPSSPCPDLVGWVKPPCSSRSSATCSSKAYRPTHIIRVPLDQVTATEDMLDPILRITAWVEHSVTPATFNALAHQGQPAYLFFNEVQHIRNWSNQFKFLVDHSAVKVVATGSSALRIEPGHNSLAGRMSTVEAGTLSLSEIAEFRGMASVKHFPLEESFGQFHRLEFWQELVEHGRRNAAARDQVFNRFSERGGYPMAHDPSQPPADWLTLAHRLNEDAIRPMLQLVLLTEPRGQDHDAAMTETMFEIACRYAGADDVRRQTCPGKQPFVRRRRRR